MPHTNVLGHYDSEIEKYRPRNLSLLTVTFVSDISWMAKRRLFNVKAAVVCGSTATMQVSPSPTLTSYLTALSHLYAMLAIDVCN